MKAIEDICRVDPRFENMVTGRPISSNVISLTMISPMRLEDHYGAIAALALPENVNHQVRGQFDIALNLATYAWFCWEFWDAAAHKAIDCYELGLKDVLSEQINIRNEGLAREKAKKGKRLTTRDAQVYLSWLIRKARENNNISEEEYQISDNLRMLRNNFSHGYSSLFGSLSLDILSECSSLLVSIYSRTPKE